MMRHCLGELPNYIIPPYNGIGANEFVVDVTHEVPGPDGKLVPAVDFTSTVDTSPLAELNMWYHVLNCGFRQRISGETDFPCIYGERVGVGRSYVKLDGKLDYDQWCEGIRQGRCYVSDGRSHLLGFKANAGSSEVAVGEHGSEMKLDRSANVRLSAKVSAMLDEKPEPQPNGSATRERIERKGSFLVLCDLCVPSRPSKIVPVGEDFAGSSQIYLTGLRSAQVASQRLTEENKGFVCENNQRCVSMCPSANVTVAAPS